MEYGVFSEPGVSWIIIWIALSLVAAGFLLKLIASRLKISHEEKKAIFGSRVSNGAPPNTALYASGIILFFSAFVLLIVGFGQSCRAERAAPGVYRVMGARLVYYADYARNEKNEILSKDGLYLWKPTEPNYFELRLEGRVDGSHSLSLMTLRIVNVPYDRVTENYNYALKTLPSTIKSNPPGSLSYRPKDWGPEIPTPKFIVQYPNGWWKFTDVGPEK